MGTTSAIGSAALLGRCEAAPHAQRLARLERLVEAPGADGTSLADLDGPLEVGLVEPPVRVVLGTRRRVIDVLGREQNHHSTHGDHAKQRV